MPWRSFHCRTLSYCQLAQVTLLTRPCLQNLHLMLSDLFFTSLFFDEWWPMKVSSCLPVTQWLFEDRTNEDNDVEIISVTIANQHTLQSSTAESGASSVCHPKAKGTKPNSNKSEDHGQKKTLVAKPKVIAKVVSSGNTKLWSCQNGTQKTILIWKLGAAWKSAKFCET